MDYKEREGFGGYDCTVTDIPTSFRSYLGSKSSSCWNGQNFLPKTYRRQLRAKQWNRSPRSFVKNQADHSKTVHEEDKDVDISQATLIWRALKLPIYSVALVPLTVSFSTLY